MSYLALDFFLMTLWAQFWFLPLRPMRKDAAYLELQQRLWVVLLADRFGVQAAVEFVQRLRKLLSLHLELDNDTQTLCFCVQ